MPMQLFCRRFFASVLTMVKVLNVAEKNDAAKSIADVLTRGRFNRREGFSQYNKIYEFEHMLFNQPCQMVMTSVSGHLLSHDFGVNYRKWNSCNPVALFDLPIEKSCPENMINIKRTLERETRGAQYLIVWTDCDREGENIGFEVIQVCKTVKSSIKVYRARFSEITSAAINRALANLGPPCQNTSDAVDVRSELDLRIGAAFTRFQTLRLQKVFPNVLSDQLISYGSCQFPTLGFVVERYKQVQSFIPEPFWKIKVEYKRDDKNVEFSWKRNRLFDYLACFVLYQHCLELPTAKVIDSRGRSKSKYRPQPLDTVELEKLASRKLKINAKETMRVAEKLYTSGLISYPRTETNMFAKEIDLPQMVENQTRDPNWGEFAQRVLERGPTPRNGRKTDNAHPPIHPTKYANNLQGNEKKIYEFIVRHFLACCSEDAQGFETTVEIDVNEERFTAQGLMITARNYLDVYPYDQWSGKEIPVFNVGDEFEPTAIEMLNGETSPPLLLSEADLIALMDKHGIGTDATHAEHIETIKNRNYVGARPDGRLVPGQLGMGLVEGYDAMGYEMSKPHLRAELESDLKKICEGVKQKQAVLEIQVEKYKEVFIEACRQAIKIDEALSIYLNEDAQPAAEANIENMPMPMPVLKCPTCGNDMTLRTKKDKTGFFIGCTGFPNCKTAIWLPESIKEIKVMDDTCEFCGPDTRLLDFKFRANRVPPTVPLEYTGCVGGCDDMLINDVGIRPPKSTSSATTGVNGGIVNNNLSRSTINNQQGNRRNMSTVATAHLDRAIVTPTYVHTSNNSNNHQNQTSRWNDNNLRTSLSPRQSQSNTYSQNRGDNKRVPLSAVNRNIQNTNTGDTNNIVCNCGNDAIQLTVRKEGPNTGRQFYKCGGSSCSFFLWADEAGNQSGQAQNNSRFRQDNGGYQNTYRKNGQKHYTQQPQQECNIGDVCCNCGNPAKQLTVQKEGPNKGRQFFACPAPRGEGCNFFQWGDESNGGIFGDGGKGRGTTQGGRKRQASSEGGGPVKRGKKCGLCGVEGHTKRTCPHR